MPQRDAFIAHPNRCLPLTRQLIERGRPWCGGALQASSCAGCFWYLHHLPRRLVLRLPVGKSGTADISEAVVGIKRNEGNDTGYQEECAVEHLVRQQLFEDGFRYSPHEHCHREGALGLLAVSYQVITDWRSTALGNVPRRSWLWMFRITHVWCSLIMDADSPKRNESSVDDQRDERVKNTGNPGDRFAEEYED